MNAVTDCRMAGRCGRPSGRRGLIVGTVDDELIAASQELLRHGLPGTVPRELSGQHRLIPLAADVEGNVAVTVFVRRLQHGPLAGMPGIETAQFQRRDGTWAYLGGGAGGPSATTSSLTAPWPPASTATCAASAPARYASK